MYTEKITVSMVDEGGGFPVSWEQERQLPDCCRFVCGSDRVHGASAEEFLAVEAEEREMACVLILPPELEMRAAHAHHDRKH